jgi:hypothetical protein
MSKSVGPKLAQVLKKPMKCPENAGKQFLRIFLDLSAWVLV